MECQRLRSVVHVFGEAPVEWDELTKDAVSLAIKDNQWPKVCSQSNVERSVKVSTAVFAG